MERYITDDVQANRISLEQHHSQHGHGVLKGLILCLLFYILYFIFCVLNTHSSLHNITSESGDNWAAVGAN